MNNYKNNERAVNQKDKNLKTKSLASLYKILDTKIDKNNCQNKELTLDQKSKDLNAKSLDSASKYTSNRDIDVHQPYEGSLLIELYANKIDEY